MMVSSSNLDDDDITIRIIDSVISSRCSVTKVITKIDDTVNKIWMTPRGEFHLRKVVMRFRVGGKHA